MMEQRSSTYFEMLQLEADSRFRLRYIQIKYLYIDHQCQETYETNQPTDEALSSSS